MIRHLTTAALIALSFATAGTARADDEIPKAKGHDAAIEKLIASNYVRIYPDWKAVKVLLTGSRTSWEVKRAPNGSIVSRSIYATILTRKEDKCEVYSTYWEQQYDGKSFSGEVQEHGQGATEETKIDCAKIK